MSSPVAGVRSAVSVVRIAGYDASGYTDNQVADFNALNNGVRTDYRERARPISAAVTRSPPTSEASRALANLLICGAIRSPS